MSPDLIRQLKAARRVSVPLVAIATPDPAATIDVIATQVSTNGAAGPLLQWDVVDGIRTVRANDAESEAVRAAIVGEFDPTLGNPLALLQQARRSPEKTIILMHLAHRWWESPAVVQAAWNLRDQFKANRRMLIMLCTSVGGLPTEIAGDVVVLDEPLPTPDALEKIVLSQHEAADQKPPEAKSLARAVEAIQGLPAFQAEQVVAMSMTKAGLNAEQLWERKRKQIELTPGLKVQRDDVRYGDIGGVDVVKDFLKRILGGQARPNAIVFIDEIEKFLAGSTGGGHDTSGVSQDQLGQLLAYMQDHGAAGCIFVGPPGSAKSMVAKATGNEAGIPTIALDLGGMKGSLVGQSEQNLRAALKVITSVSNGRSLWIATCNAIADLPPELRRRFTLGTFFFDLPTPAERAAIWKLYVDRLGLSREDLKAIRKLDDGWTGAEIRQACDIAWRLGCTLTEAAAFVVPVSRSASEQLAKLRSGADGRFLSASNPGVYRRQSESAPVAGPRKLELGEGD